MIGVKPIHPKILESVNYMAGALCCGPKSNLKKKDMFSFISSRKSYGGTFLSHQHMYSRRQKTFR